MKLVESLLVAKQNLYTYDEIMHGNYTYNNWFDVNVAWCKQVMLDCDFTVCLT